MIYDPEAHIRLECSQGCPSYLVRDTPYLYVGSTKEYDFWKVRKPRFQPDTYIYLQYDIRTDGWLELKDFTSLNEFL